MREATDRELLERALRSQLGDQAVLVISAHLGLALLVWLVLYRHLPTAALTQWTGAIASAALLRTSWLARVIRTPPPRRRLLFEHRFTTALLGSAWGVGTGFLAAQMPAYSFAVIFAMISAITAGAIVTLPADRGSFFAMLTGIAGPLFLGLILFPPGGNLSLLLAIACFGMTIMLYRRTHGQLLDHLRTMAELGESREALAREQAHLTGVLESAPVGIAVLDEDKRVRSVNAQFESIFGWTREELPGRLLDDLIIPEDQEAEHHSLLARVRGGEIIHAEVKRRTRDGRALDVRVSAVALRNAPEGGFIATYEDISARKTMERALIASEARMRRVIDSNIVGISLWNVDGRILTANDEMLRLTGYTREDLSAGRARWTDTVPPEEAERDAAVVQGLMEGIRQEPWRCDMLRRDGSRLPVLLGLGALDERLETEGVAFALDMTETSRIERELRDARDQAERAARSQAAFLANMSHEIRTPMNAVLGMIQIVLGSALEEGQRRSLTMAQNAADSLLRILNDILDYSRIEADRLPIEAIPFDLPEVVQSTVDMFAIQAQQKRLALHVTMSPGLPGAVRGDPSRIRQVLSNLLGNAIKFTSSGSVTVAVRGDAGSGRIRFSVRDTGIGIPPEALRHIFEKFHQADSTTSRRFGGTGLGLAIAQRLVKLMGGDISVTSAVNEGTEFVFRLPLAPAEPAAAEPAPPALAPAPARPLRVLLVEDVEVNQLVAETMLRQRGHSVDIAGDGRAAVEAVTRNEYDVVLMDIQMPVMDGIEATAAIRALPAHADVPIVALTAHAMRDERERCLARGMDGYLTKPFKADELFAVTESAVRARAA